MREIYSCTYTEKSGTCSPRLLVGHLTHHRNRVLNASTPRPPLVHLHCVLVMSVAGRISCAAHFIPKTMGWSCGVYERNQINRPLNQEADTNVPFPVCWAQATSLRTPGIISGSTRTAEAGFEVVNQPVVSRSESSVKRTLVG